MAGHCFDDTKVFEVSNKNNNASRLSMAMQAGAGTHINITRHFDCSLTSQYMVHFGKDIDTEITGGKVLIYRSTNTVPDGHLLFTLSLNYKLLKLW